MPIPARLDVGQALAGSAGGRRGATYLRLGSVMSARQVSQQAAQAVEPPSVYCLMLPWAQALAASVNSASGWG